MPAMTTLTPEAEADLIDAALDELNMDAATATDRQRALVGRRIQQTINAKVLPFLNRENFDVYTVVVPGLWLVPGYDPTHVDAWTPRPVFPDRVRVLSHTPNVEDPELYDVTFEVGLSLANPEAAAILDFIAVDAAESLTGHPAFPSAPPTVKSVSGGGQSMSWETRASTPDAPGGKLVVASLARFKRFNVGVAAPPVRANWPYDGPLQ